MGDALVIILCAITGLMNVIGWAGVILRWRERRRERAIDIDAELDSLIDDARLNKVLNDLDEDSK